MSDDFDMGGDMSSDFDTDTSFDTSDFDMSDADVESSLDDFPDDFPEDVETELSDEVLEEMSSEFEEDFENDIPEDIIEEDFVEKNGEDILNQKIDDIVNNENLSMEAKTELLNDIKDSALGAMFEEAVEIPEDVEEDGETVKVLQMGDSDTTVVYEDTEQKLADLEEGYQNSNEMEENIFEHILEDESLSEEERMESLQNLREDAQGLVDQYYSDVAEAKGDEIIKEE